MTEEERKQKITEFYNAKPDAFACDDCVVEISQEQVERSAEITGMRYCGICLAIKITQGKGVYEDQKTWERHTEKAIKMRR